ncbi:MAG: hypothetical protein ACXIUD_02090 [Mongoliitalea sp.]
MQERDILLRWLRAFFESLNRLLNKSYVDKREIQDMYPKFFGKNRVYFLEAEGITMIEELFLESDDTTKKEKLSALCQLMELDLKLEEDVRLRQILKDQTLSINDLLLKKYGYFRVGFH